MELPGSRLSAWVHIIAALLLGFAWMVLLVHAFMEASLTSSDWLPRFVSFSRAARLVGPDLQVGLLPSLVVAVLAGTWIRRGWLWLVALPFTAWQVYGALAFEPAAVGAPLADSLLLNLAAQVILLLVFSYLAGFAAGWFRR